MKKFLKVLGAAALIAGLTPYWVETNEETGKWKVKALLWQASKKPNPCGDKDDITVKFLSFGKDEEEAQLFSDELTVEYSVGQTAAAADTDACAEDAPAEEETPEEDLAEDEAPVEE